MVKIKEIFPINRPNVIVLSIDVLRSMIQFQIKCLISKAILAKYDFLCYCPMRKKTKLIRSFNAKWYDEPVLSESSKRGWIKPDFCHFCVEREQRLHFQRNWAEFFLYRIFAQFSGIFSTILINGTFFDIVCSFMDVETLMKI